MSLGFEIELPTVRVKATLPGASKPKLLEYSGLKGFPLFRTQNRRISGVIEVNGAGGSTLVELVTAPDEDPYTKSDTGWKAQLENVGVIARGLTRLSKTGLTEPRLPEALAAINKLLADPWSWSNRAGLRAAITGRGVN